MKTFNRTKIVNKSGLFMSDVMLVKLWECCMESTGNSKKFYAFVNNIESLSGDIITTFKKFLSFKCKSTDGMYNVDFLMLKHNISREDATNKVAAIKREKSTSLDSFIKRHGVELGSEKFKTFQESSRAPHRWLDEVDESTKLEYGRKNSRRCWEFYVERGLASNQIEGEVLANQYQRDTAGVHRRVYLDKGMLPSDVDVIIADINSRKGVDLIRLRSMYPEDWLDRHMERVSKFRQTIGATPRELLNERDSYYCEVHKYTELSWKLYKPFIGNTELYERTRNFHLDHKISKIYGFLNDIPPEVIGHPMNLELIPCSINTSKQGNCSITVDELLNLIQEFKNEGY